MIARVILTKRLPKQLSYLDYTIPSDLEDKIKLGQLVEVPYRTTQEFGVVFELPEEQEHSSSTLKELISIVHETPIFSHKQRALLPVIANFYDLSWSTMALMMMPPIQKRKLRKLELTILENKEKNLPLIKPEFALYSNKTEHQSLVQNIATEHTLILVPRQHQVNEVFALLTPEQQEKTLLWHSELSVKDKFEVWAKIRNAEKHIVIGTRGAVFLPFSTLRNILIDFEHDENHKHWDQAPRFSSKDVALFLAKAHGASLTLASFSASVESYFHIHKDNYITHKKYTALPSRASLINMADERRGKNYSCFGYRAEEELLNASGDVFIFINRLGFASSIGCKECSHVETCPNCHLPYVYYEKTRRMRCHYCKHSAPAALMCSSCKVSLTVLRGIGTEGVESQVRALVGLDSKHVIIRCDSGTEPDFPETDQPRILIGTEMAFAKIRWDKTSVVIFVDIDKQMLIPEYRAEERVWQMLQEVNYRLPQDGRFYIQTHNPKQLVIRSLTEPDRFYRTSLNLRRTLQYPPYIFLTRYFYGHVDKRVAEQEANKAHLLIKETLQSLKKEAEIRLTDSTFSAMVSAPIEMHPHYYRGKFWYTMLIRIPEEHSYQILNYLNKKLPPTWKIDPNPISILSP